MRRLTTNLAGLVVLGITAQAVLGPSVAEAAQGILIPAYFGTSDTYAPYWNSLTLAAAEVPIIAVVNNGDGPGTEENPALEARINALRSAGAEVFGYVYTTGTSRSIAAVEGDIDNWITLFGTLDGMFIDNYTNDNNESHYTYYETLYDYCKYKNANWTVVGNPGWSTQETYLTRPTADILMVYESPHSNPYSSYSTSAWNYDYDRSHFSILAYGDSTMAIMRSDLTLAVSRNVGWTQITDDTAPDSNDTLPTYWWQYVHEVAKKNGATLKTWNSTSGGSWGTSSKWTPSGAPSGANNIADISTKNITANRTVTLDGDRTIGHLLFGDITATRYAWTLATGTGGTLTLDVTTGSPTIDVLPSCSATISAVIAGSDGLAKVDTGTLTLSGANTYTGDTKIIGGTLTLGNSSALQNSTLDYFDTGTLSFGSLTSATFGGLKGSKSLALTNASSNAVALTVGGNNGSTSYSGVLSGSGSLTKIGTGTLTLDAFETYTGATTVSGGTLALNVAGTPASGGVLTHSSGVYIQNGGTLRVDKHHAIGYDQVPPITVYTGGTLTISSDIICGLSTSSDLSLQGGTLASIGTPNAYGTWFLWDDVAVGGGTTSTMSATAMNLQKSGGVTFTVDSGSTLNVTGTFTTKLEVGDQPLIKAGAGSMILAGSNAYTGATTVSAGKLRVNGSIASSSGVSVASGATLDGYGTVPAISGAGLVSPGNSPGILTAASINPSSGLDLALELTASGSPTYGDPDASVNDVLHLTGGTPFSSALTSSDAVDVYFGVSSLAAGTTFRGGVYVDSSSDFVSSVSSGTYSYYVLGDGSGTHAFNGVNYYTLGEYNAALGVTLSTVAETANFGGGSIDGRVMQFYVHAPEPGTLAMLAAGLIGLFTYAWRKRK